MTEATPSNWYLRQGGIVQQASWAVTDPAPFHLANAYAKTWRGEDLTPEEAAALAKVDAPPQHGPAASYGEQFGDLALGVVAHHRPDILERLDALAADLAAALLGDPAAGAADGMTDVRAWSLLSDYTRRAMSVTMEEAGLGLDPAARRDRIAFTPEEIAAAEAETARQVAFNEAWSNSSEGQAAVAALETPDDGPEGWSTVPPAEPSHPCHPSRRPRQ